MALLAASSFSTSVAPLYVNGSPVAAPARPDDPVTLPMSSGASVTVFDSLTTALKCLEYMKESGVWCVMASNNALVVSVSHHKLLIMDNTLRMHAWRSSMAVHFMWEAWCFLQPEHRTTCTPWSLP